jgi:hypothetical protein
MHPLPPGIKDRLKRSFSKFMTFIESTKKLKFAYIAVLCSTVLNTNNILIIMVLNICADLIITNIYIGYKFKSGIKRVTKNPDSFNSILKTTKPNNSLKLPFLLGTDGTSPIYVDLSKLIHTLIAGRSGKGKSNFINQLLQSMLWLDKGCLALFLCDMKSIELCHDYRDFQNCRTLNTAEDLLKVVTGIRIEMQSRYKLMENVDPGQKTYKKIEDYNNSNYIKLPYIVLLIDEFADLNYIKDTNLKDTIWDEIKWVLREGRAAGTIIILATQRPTKENIPCSIKGLIVTFIGFGVKDNNESYYCGVQGSSNLPIGEFIINGESFDNKKMKSYHIKPDDEIYYELYNTYNKEEFTNVSRTN